VKLMKVTLQHMYRTINVNTVKLSDCRRIVLYHYHPPPSPTTSSATPTVNNSGNGYVEMRHYAIKANPVGISKSIQKILQTNRELPDLGSLEDIAEYIDSHEYSRSGVGGGSGYHSDSEVEDESSKVTLAERFVGRGNARQQLSAMKLIELGPRITMELFKVEQGMNEGDVLYHKFMQKTPEEIAALKQKVRCHNNHHHYLYTIIRYFFCS
jgi:ribosome biogenesis protein SSF1/2